MRVQPFTELAALPVLALDGPHGQPHLLIHRAGQESAHGMHATRLANPIWASSAAAGNAGGRDALSWHLLSGCQLDLCGADRRARAHGPGAQKPRSSHQRHLRLSAGSRSPPVSMRLFDSVNKHTLFLWVLSAIVPAFKSNSLGW